MKVKCHTKQRIDKSIMRRIRRSTIRTSTKKKFFSMKSTMKELNAIIHEVNAIQIVRGLKLIIKINKKIIEAFVNLKIISNFIF